MVVACEDVLDAQLYKTPNGGEKCLLFKVDLDRRARCIENGLLCIIAFTVTRSNVETM